MLSERKTWELDQQINSRGFYVDVEFCRIAADLVQAELNKVNQKISDLTGNRVTTIGQRDKILAELKRLNISNLTKNTVSDTLLNTNLPERERKILELRAENNQAAVKKYQAILDRIGPDNRIRNYLRYHGAHTGRWTATGIQPQNLFKPEYHWEEIDSIIDLIKNGDLEWVKFVYGSNLLGILNSCLRSVFIAAPNHDLYCGDFASIELRANLWLANDTKHLNQIRNGVDLYIDFAANQIYNIPVDKVTKQQRFVAKQAVLGLGYGMGADRFIAYCAQFGIEIEKELAAKIIVRYRKVYRKIKNNWYNLEEAFKNALKNGRSTYGPLVFENGDPFFSIRLPSGRRLFYFRPAVMEGSIEYFGISSRSKEWTRLNTWGGKIDENIIQGICRDLLVYSMHSVNKKYPIVLTVHDEIVSEAKKGSLQEFTYLLKKQPEWSKGIPIDIESWKGKKYRKG